MRKKFRACFQWFTAAVLMSVFVFGTAYAITGVAKAIHYYASQPSPP